MSNNDQQLDIIEIHDGILRDFDASYALLDNYRNRLTEVQISLESAELPERIRNNLIQTRDELIAKIDDIESLKSKNFYLTESMSIIAEWKEILKQPVTVSFMGKPSKNNKKKQKLINEYMEIASKHKKIEKNESLKAVVCNCGNKKDFDIMDNNTYICNMCYTQQTIIRHTSSYTDITRVNISTKYMYDRKVHFRDCINQYHGKQNSTIPQKVYDELEEQFELHHILKGDKDSPKEERFVDLTKNHILMFLKELKYSNHYENVHLIHYNFTGVKPDDISHLEEQLLDDFDQLTELYDREYKHLNRKNFINTQYVLFQLLQRHKHPCKKEEFVILKTIDRKFFHDEVCKNLFEILGWNHIPFF